MTNWWDYLEENPRELYGGMLGNQGSANFLDYWRSQYENVYNKYLGALGTQKLAGVSTEQTFYDYLKPLPFLQEWLKLTAGQRGERQPGRTFWNIPR